MKKYIIFCICLVLLIPQTVSASSLSDRLCVAIQKLPSEDQLKVKWKLKKFLFTLPTTHKYYEVFAQTDLCLSPNNPKNSKRTKNPNAPACPKNKTYDYDTGLAGGWVIPNVCDTGIPDGILSEPHPNGKPRFEIPMKNGRYNGHAKWYNEDGSVKIEGHYENGKIVGEYLWYDENAKVKQKNTYLPNNTVKVQFYASIAGKDPFLSFEYTTVNKKKHGKQYGFYTNGQMSYETDFQYGQQTGMYIEYYKNGTVKEKVGLRNGKLIQTYVAKKPERTVQNGDIVLLSFKRDDANGVTTMLENYTEKIVNSSLPDFLYTNLLGMKADRNQEKKVTLADGGTLYITVSEIERKK